MKISVNQAEIILITQIGEWQDDWIKVYLEPNNIHSGCGGRITVNIGDDHTGSHFFSHCGTKTFEGFIGNTNYDYLINKLFQTKKWIDVESGHELFESIVPNDLLGSIREARHSGVVDKEELRFLYEDLKEHEFRDIGELFNMLESPERLTMTKIFGDDWYYDGRFKKQNRVYARQKLAVQAVIDYCGGAA